MADSLIKRGDFLPGLDLPDDIQQRLEALEREQPGTLSGERIFSTRPDAYRAAVRLLARGHSLREVAAIVDISVPSVLAIRRREGHSVLTAAQKSDLSATLADVARLGAETARERLAAGEGRDIALDKLMLASAIATDKAMLLAGEATHRIEHVVRDDDGDDWERELQRWRDAGKLIEVESQDIGIEAAPAGTKGIGPASMPGDQEQGPEHAGAGRSDQGASGPDTVATDIKSTGVSTQVVDGVHGSRHDTPVDTPHTPPGAPAGHRGAGPAIRGEAGGEGVELHSGVKDQRYIDPSRISDKGGRHHG